MLNVLERIELLDLSHELSIERDFIGLIDLLDSVPKATILAEPELGHYLALALSQTDNQGEADRLLEELERICANRGNDRLFRRRMNLQAVSYVRQGRLSEANDLFRDVQLASDVSGDSKFLATATMNLGVIADMRCEWTSALAHYRYALVLFQKIGDRASTAGCYHNLGMLHRQMRDLDAAELFLERAQENYESCGTVEERIATELERSLTIRDQGDIYRALAIAELALTRSRSIENTRLIAEALRCVGIPLADHGNFADARMFFQEGLGLSGVSGNQLLNGELNEELAILELAEGDLLNSALYLEAARKMYLQLGCASRAERATYRYNQFDQKNLQLGHRHT